MGPAPRNRSKPMWQLKEDQDQLEPKEDLWGNEKNKPGHTFQRPSPGARTRRSIEGFGQNGGHSLIESGYEGGSGTTDCSADRARV